VSGCGASVGAVREVRRLMLTRKELAELAAMDPPATPEEVAWADEHANATDPGTDTPADKLRQRRAVVLHEEMRRREEQGAESPLLKFARVWGAAA
jgi:hypothetical protein